LSGYHEYPWQCTVFQRLKKYILGSCTFSYHWNGQTTVILILPTYLVHICSSFLFQIRCVKISTFEASSLWVSRITLLTVTNWVVIWNFTLSIWSTVTGVHTQAIDTRFLKGTFRVGCATNIWCRSYRKWNTTLTS
jgi:hypothetical protein